MRDSKEPKKEEMRRKIEKKINEKERLFTPSGSQFIFLTHPKEPFCKNADKRISKLRE